MLNRWRGSAYKIFSNLNVPFNFINVSPPLADELLKLQAQPHFIDVFEVFYAHNVVLKYGLFYDGHVYDAGEDQFSDKAKRKV